MRLTRREWLGTIAATASASVGGLANLSAQERDLEAVAGRAAAIIAEYEAQGFHRTATAVDRVSGDWLANHVRRTGLTPAQEPFSLSRVDPLTTAAVVGGRRLDGIPLFDGTFTDAGGVRGSLGPVDSDADIGVVDTMTNAAGTGALGEARRRNRHKAIVAITRGRRPGLCPSNADAFRQPFGPPVLQVAWEESAWLIEHAARGTETQVIAHVNRSPASATNVTTQIAGASPDLPPFVVMTPRSGWYWCASERGGGIVCWLEIMRALRDAKLRRTVLFVASSGHELGHLGIDAFIARRPGIAPKAVGWLHLGANIGAAVDAGTTLQASHDDLDAALTSAMTAAGVSVSQRNPRGRVPSGEAEAVHRGGGRYVSTIGGNGLFHNLKDRGPEAIDANAIAKFSAAFTTFVQAQAT